MPRNLSRSAASTLLLILTTGILPGILAGRPQRPPSQAASPSGDQIPHLWKSETTSHEYRVQIDGDVLRAEWVNLPADLARNGAFVRTECRRVGNRWIGTTRSRLLLPCTDVPGPSGRHPSAWCSLVTRTEIDTVSPEGITGRAQAPTRLDCQACKLLDAEWKDFAWTPKK